MISSEILPSAQPLTRKALIDQTLRNAQWAMLDATEHINHLLSLTPDYEHRVVLTSLRDRLTRQIDALAVTRATIETTVAS